MMKTKHKIDDILYCIQEMIEMEECDTFPTLEVEKWIELLKEGDLNCPCNEFEYDITKCRFYEYQNCDDCEVCNVCADYDKCDYDEEPCACGVCDDCSGYNTCSDCPRSGIWERLQNHAAKEFKMSKDLVLWFTGQMMAKRLEELL